MSLNFDVVMRDHGSSSLREIDDAITLLTSRLVRLHHQRTALAAYLQLHESFHSHLPIQEHNDAV
jgi:hypothetical protein